MKKMIFGALACAGVLALGACSNGKCNGGSCQGALDDDDQVYTGILPAADADGIRYTLWLDYEDDMKDGDFDMLQSYFQIDSVGVIRDLKSFMTKGDFTVETRGADKYLKLIEKGNPNQPVYFQMTEPGTITMVNADLQLPEDTIQNYSLQLVK